MNRLSCLVAVGIALTALSGCRFDSEFTIHSGQDATPSQQSSGSGSSSNDPLAYEAEGANFQSPITLETNSNASGGQYLLSGRANTGTIAFQVSVPRSTDYIIWAHVLAPNSDSDSYFVSVDGGPEDVFDIAEGHWSSGFQYSEVNGRGSSGTPLSLNPRVFSLSAGAHRIAFRAREAGAGLDRILLSDDPHFTPDASVTPNPLPSATPTATPSPTPSASATPSPSPSPIASSGTGSSFYVSPSGRSDASGSIDDPWDLQTALDGGHGKIHPGDTVYLRAGTYRGPSSGLDNTSTAAFTSRLNGSTSAQVVVRGYPGERATVDGGIQVFGSYTTLRDFEVMNSAKYPGVLAGINVGASCATGETCVYPGLKIINMVSHDNGVNGVGVWEQAPNAEIYGNVLYYNGRQQHDNAHGHGVYFQNLASYAGYSSTKVFEDNVAWNGFGYGIHGYGEKGNIQNIEILGNFSINNNGMDLHVGGSQPLENVTIDHNYLYRDRGGVAMRVGFFGYSSDGQFSGPDSPNTDTHVTNNMVVGGGGVLLVAWGQSCSFKNNTVVDLIDQASMGLIMYPGQTASSQGYDWDSNHYLGALSFFMQGTSGGSFFSRGYSFSDWKSVTGVDALSSSESGLPTGSQVIVRPNKYEQGRANIMIYNWDQKASVGVNLSQTGLAAGQGYRIVDAENFYGPAVVSGIYDPAHPVVSLPMTLTAVSAPQNITEAPASYCYSGESACPAVPNPPSHTSSRLAVFVVLPGSRI